MSPGGRAVRRLEVATESVSGAIFFAIIDVVSFFLYLALLGYSLIGRLVRGRRTH
jgi:hypothetical protein